MTDRAGDPFQDRGQRRVDPVVVAEQHGHVGGQRPGDQQPGVTLQRQDAVVLEQRDRAYGGAPAKCGVRVEVDLAGGGGRVSQHAQPLAERQDAGERSVDVGLIDNSSLQRLGERSVAAADLHVTPGAQRCRRRLSLVAGVPMPLVAIGDRERVAHDQPPEAPVAPQRLLQQFDVGAARHAVDGVVGRHDRGDPGIDRGLERRQVGLLKVLRCHRHVEAVPERLRPAVHGEVLGARRDPRGRGIRPLQAADGGPRHRARQKRILAEGLVAAAPARVAEDVDVRRAKGEAPVALATAGEPMLVERLGGDRLVHFLDQPGVEGGSQGDRLREDGGDAGARHAVQALAPPVVGGDSQPRYGRRLVHEERHLLLRPQGGDQVSDAALRHPQPPGARAGTSRRPG